MGGGLMQLVAYGAQDIYLTGNPQITFFKVVYRRHTNFSMEAIEQTMNGTTDVTSDNQTATCTISRNGDLIHKVYVTTDSATSALVTDYEGSKLIKEVELEIGGQRIDRHYTEWNQVWEELCTSESKAIGLKAMKGDIGTRHSATEGTGCKVLQIPLNFWFCRNVGLALPLIALQYHEVKLKFQWAKPSAANSDPVKCNVIVDYIYLDTDERRRFAQVSHEYLIEQIQRFETTAPAAATHSVNLNFNHPVKELIWTNDAFIESTGTGKVQLKLNGHDRFSERPLEYFQIRQPYEYHTAVPRQNLPTAAQLMADSVSFSDDRLAGTTLETAVPETDGTVSASPGDISSGDLPAVTSGTFTFGQTSTNAYSYAPATTLRGTDGSFSSASPDTVAFIFLAGEATPVFVSGRTYRITVSGNASASGGDTSKAVIARVTSVQLGANGDNLNGSIANDNQIVYFSEFLTQSADGTVASTDMSILLVEELVAETVQTTQARTSKLTRKINVYSFGLKPEEHQPSGTCNFSRIDSAKLNFSHLSSSEGSGDNRKINIYAVNYNVLRIMSGMGGLAYSN